MRNIIEYKDLVWVDILEPSAVDLSYLKTKFNLHPLTLKNIIPSVPHPDFDFFPEYVFMTLHYPRNEEGGDVEIYELDIIAGKNFIITNHYKLIKPIDSIFKKCVESETHRQEYMQYGSESLLILLLNAFLGRLLQKVDEINKDTGLIEKSIFTANERVIIEKISYLKRRIITFWRAMEPQREIFNSLRSANNDFFSKEYRHHFTDLYRIYERIDNSLKTLKDTIEALEETNHGIINLKRNDTMKVLTVFSVVLMPLTLIASIWGMNTTFLPFRDVPLDFYIITGIMLVIFIIMLIYFRLKKWL
jgi:magnesium transporter